jgi:cytochrome c peroxidase
MRCSQKERSLRCESSRETTCFAARGDATSATETADPAKTHYSPTSPRAISAFLLTPRLPYYEEDQSDKFGYAANPQGTSFVDAGVGSFLEQGHLLSQPSAVDQRWLKLAPDNQARMQVPTLRNVDKRPYPAFVKAYGHNGYFTSLKGIVHFYNTRDVLPRCKPHDAGEGTTCWPTPESTANMNRSKVGNLGRSNAEEDALVAFMQMLTDGFMPRQQQ